MNIQSPVPSPHNDRRVADSDFKEIRALLDRESSIQLEDRQRYVVETRLRPLLRRYELTSITQLLAQLRGPSGEAILAGIVDALTTNETSFFRDEHPFDALSERLIPELLAVDREGPITVWCAACSSGQEPYSIAILIRETFPELVETGGIRIIATDLSPTMIERCREGRYSHLEMTRGLPSELLAKYFEQDDQDWVARESIRSMVEFREHNLVGPWSDIPRADIVMMRNVLIYLPSVVKAELLGRVRFEVLRPRGSLFLGSSETIHNTDDHFDRLEHGRAVFYRSPVKRGSA